MHRVDTYRAIWRKSSRSEAANGGGQCVEIAAVPGHPGHTAVRDSKHPHGPTRAFTARGWTAFVAGIKRGDYQ